MAVRFNNNNSGWMEEMQILFDKINNGSPFGVIRFVIAKTSKTKTRTI
nr:hypothetical protein [Helicobacter pylori]